MSLRKASVIALAVLAAGCADMSPYRYAQTYSMIEPAVSADKEFDDGKISIRFHIGEKRIFFNLRNRTGQPMAVDWNEAAYVSLDGARHPVAGTDFIFSTKLEKLGLTETPPGGEDSDFAAPLRNREKLEEWTWSLTPMFDLASEKATDNKGKVFGLDLPIRVEGEWKTYRFRFKVLNVIPIHQRV